MGKMQTQFPSVETGWAGKGEMTGIQINYQGEEKEGEQPGTGTDQPPETEITPGGMAGAGLQLREDPDHEMREKDLPTAEEEILYRRSC